MKLVKIAAALVCLVAGISASTVTWAQDDGVAATTEPTSELPWRGDPCAHDSDCYWDDGCFPTRCINSEQAAPDECEESAPPPGTCSCVERQCTLTPHTPDEQRSAEAGCTSDSECAVDIGSATCHLNGNTDVGPIDRQGPICLCDEASATCVFDWVEPVLCGSFRDCWFETEPRLRPVRSERRREAPLEPCVDGEIDAICAGRGLERFCAIISWDC